MDETDLAPPRGASDLATDSGGLELGAVAGESSTPFVGQWRRLVSTTNWEKGRINAAWRSALEAQGARPTEYSDEAWAQLVGGVTAQHVGRLRRVHQRFGAVAEEYQGVYWSHVHAALDWDDAEMWLEGALPNGWSVSQMRARRWEVTGAGPDGAAADTDEATGPDAIIDDDDAGDGDDDEDDVL